MSEPAAAKLMDDLAAAGFLYLGGFAVEGDSTVPRLSGGKAPGALFLIGSTGPSLWPHLTRSPEFRDGAPDPLDRYTKRILSASAIDYGFEALFPFEGPPYHPFQQWALRCGGFPGARSACWLMRNMAPGPASAPLSSPLAA
ncbi:hypothetical protein ACFQEX_00670 [Roseibium salinum]|uniref:hypothetical protein n=1 Tax=Roseibium salinum TaxID=1604349 RepID=UPI00361E2537